MAIGPGMFIDEYKDLSVEELEKILEDLKKYLYSDELKRARQEELDMEIDDNDCIANVRTEIDVIENLLKVKKTKWTDSKLNEEENHRCPKCYSILKEYVYGKIKGQIDTNKYIVGGCILREKNPTYYCSKCNYDYDENLNLMTETLESVVKDYVGNEPFWTDIILNFFEKCKIDTNKQIELFKDISKDKAIFNEFTKDILKSNDPESLLNKYNQQKREFSQEELKDFFYYCMTEKELDKIRELDLNSMIEKIQSPTYQIKYIENVGYILIGEGYLILDNGTEPTHYFAKIFTSDEEIKNEIINIYNEKFSNV